MSIGVEPIDFAEIVVNKILEYEFKRIMWNKSHYIGF